MAARRAGIAVPRPRHPDRNRADPGLHLALGQKAMTDDPAMTIPIGQIRMHRNMRINLGFNRLGQQLPGAGAQ